MGRNKNNAIILTSILGERGPQGFQGEDGIACYTGTGDPNTLTLTLPDYSGDPSGFVRGRETLYYQDTVTGEVWTSTYKTATGSQTAWTLTFTNLKGDKGSRGATAIDKIDINLMIGGAMSSFTSLPGQTVTETEVCKINFPGTDVAPDFTEVKAVASYIGSTNAGSAYLVVEDLAGIQYSVIQVSGSSPSIYSETGITFPTSPTILLVKVYPVDFNTLDNEIVEIKVGYISIR